MEETRTASEELELIEKAFFKRAGLRRACSLKGEARRDYILAQVDRLLQDKRMGCTMAMHLSDRFWTADEGRNQYTDPNPLQTSEGLLTLTDKEKERLRLIEETAGLCHDLTLYFEFCVKDAFGIRYNDLWVSNTELVEWLTTTKYEHVAMYTAYTMRRFAIGVYAYGHYLPAQDHLAEIYSSDYGTLVREPDNTPIPARAYVDIILKALREIERHEKRGKRLKLRPDLLMLHDEIYGMIPSRFDKNVLQAAQALFDYMDEQIFGRLTMIDRRYGYPSWDDLPDEGKRAAIEVMNQFADKVREVRAKYLPEGWIEDDSLEFLYLMDHAQRCGYGFWKEEDEAL